MNSNWLAQLAPEHRPAPPPWWPPAPGWWLAASLCLICLAVLVGWRVYSGSRRRRARFAALAELARIRIEADDATAAENIQRLLRRYALTVFGADRVAPLTGESWIQFVATHGGDPLAADIGRSLLRAAFGNLPMPAQRESWLAGAEAFIRRAARRKYRAAA